MLLVVTIILKCIIRLHFPTEGSKVRYMGFLGDGDSKAHNELIQRRVYGDEQVTKLDCVGHIHIKNPVIIFDSKFEQFHKMSPIRGATVGGNSIGNISKETRNIKANHNGAVRKDSYSNFLNKQERTTVSAKSTWNACTVLRIFYPRPVSEAVTRMYTPFPPYTMLDQ